MISMPAKELFQCYEGVVFIVKDYDKLGASDPLGACVVTAKELYLGKGERMEYMLKPLLGQKDYKKVSICAHNWNSDNLCLSHCAHYIFTAFF
jgi:hypothetical protein